jgi:hypothetical protein
MIPDRSAAVEKIRIFVIASVSSDGVKYPKTKRGYSIR